MAKDFFEIDPLALDEAWLEQPKLYHDYALKLADAREALERAKSQRDVITAEVDLAIRQDPQSHGLNSTTEKAIERVLTVHERIKEATDKVLKAKHRVDILQANIETLDHRKKALENMVQLLSMDYFASPRAEGSSREAVEDLKYKKAFKKGVK